MTFVGSRIPQAYLALMKFRRCTIYRSLGALLAVSLFTPPPEAPAAILVSYTFDTVTSNSSASIDTDLNSVASNIAAFGGTAASGVTMVASGTGNPAPSGAMQGANTVSAANAITNNDYWEFTLSPDSGYKASLTSLTLQFQRSDGNSPTSLFIRSNIDSYASNLFSDSSLPASPTAFESGTLTLSSLPAFQDLTAPVTFRIYAFGSNNTTSSLRIDNVVLNGSVIAVPEASSSLLLLAGVGLVLGYGRSRKRSV